MIRNSVFSLFLVLVGCSAASAQYYAQHTARPLSEIKQAFPYDIGLVASDATTDSLDVNSADILGQHLGKRPVVMMFWLTTCGPCKMELAELSQRMEQWKAKADFAFVPVSFDFPRRRADFHSRAREYPWTSYLDVDREFPLVMPGRLNGVPQIFVFDEAGKQIFHRRKYRAGDLDALAEVLGI